MYDVCVCETNRVPNCSHQRSSSHNSFSGVYKLEPRESDDCDSWCALVMIHHQREKREIYEFSLQPFLYIYIYSIYLYIGKLLFTYIGCDCCCCCSHDIDHCSTRDTTTTTTTMDSSSPSFCDIHNDDEDATME